MRHLLQTIFVYSLFILPFTNVFALPDVIVNGETEQIIVVDDDDQTESRQATEVAKLEADKDLAG